MVTAICGRVSHIKYRCRSQHISYNLDTVVMLDINGTRQRVRLCASRPGLPPVLIVQAGPGLPVLHEVSKFQQHLQLEEHFTVAYWDQRGCGSATLQDTQGISLETQIDDLLAVIQWLMRETGQQVVVLGVSLGATLAMLAAEREADNLKALVAVSIDTDTAVSDASVDSFLQKALSQPENKRMARLIKKLGVPPYTTPRLFQLRARLLSELGAIEYEKRLSELLFPFLYSLIRTYGMFGAVAAMRNMSAIQREILPALAKMNLFESWPRLSMPVHYIFGNSDPLVPQSLVQRVSTLLACGDSVVVVPEAGHMVHFDAPVVVCSKIIQAHSEYSK